MLAFHVIGTGKSKKLAKRQAANKMWNRVKDLPSENSSISFGFEDEDEVQILVSFFFYFAFRSIVQ